MVWPTLLRLTGNFAFMLTLSMVTWPVVRLSGVRPVFRNDRFGLPPQSVVATHALNLSAGVSNSSVLRGRSLSCRAKLSPHFCRAAAAFGLALRRTPDLGDYGLDQVAQLAEGARGPDPRGERAEFLRLVREAESLLQTDGN